jgi:hypothetical protein
MRGYAAARSASQTGWRDAGHFSRTYIRPVVKPLWQALGSQDGIRSPPITIATWIAASRFVVATNQLGPSTHEM